MFYSLIPAQTFFHSLRIEFQLKQMPMFELAAPGSFSHSPSLISFLFIQALISRFISSIQLQQQSFFCLISEICFYQVLRKREKSANQFSASNLPGLLADGED